MKAIYPGSFDPLTLGHLDVINRASKVFGEILVLVSENLGKSERLDLKTRIKLIREATKDLNNIKVASSSGLTVEYAKTHGYSVLVRGLRAASDFEVELEMSQINHRLSDGIETVFFMTDPQYSYIRASRVWELVKFGGDITALVPDNVAKELKAYCAKISK
jgi:pantetheine-phosphate adenylyltransferase